MGTRPDSRLAWLDAVKGTHAGEFLRAVVERSTNVKVRSLCCYSLGGHPQRRRRRCAISTTRYAAPSTERTLNTSVRSQTGLSVSSIPKGIPIQWGVSGWPTIYVIDGNGVIRF